MNKEFKRMMKLAGLTEIKVNKPKQFSYFSREWSQLGDGYEYSNGMYETPQGFIFSYNESDNTLNSEVRYEDYGDDRDEGEEYVDPLISALENDLDDKGLKYEILTTSYAYIITIYL
jgi:hypothetical protein